MPWGTVTYNSVTNAPFGAQNGFGGLYMNPGDTLWFVNGTDASGTVIPIVEWSLPTPQSGTGAIENNAYVIG